MKEQIITGLFYLTRACNIDCEYCMIWDNHFPNELSLGKKLDALDIMWNDLDIGFIILFGGEPMMLGDDLEKVVQHCGDTGIEYAITSNSILLTREKAQCLVDAGLKNWSVSVDTLEAGKDPITAKSNKGLKDLLMLSEMGVPDLHATITVTRKNIDQIVPLVQYCTEHALWVEITALHWWKGEGYYFAQPKELMKDLLLLDNDYNQLAIVLDELISMKREGYLLHNDEEYFRDFMQYAPELNWYCEGMASLVVDADGKIKTCLHYDDLGGRWSIFDLKDSKKRTQFFVQNSGKFNCDGCFWDCRFQAQQWRDTDPKKGRRIFQHK